MVRAVLTLVAVLLFAFTFLFIWSGSESIAFSRVAMENDASTQELLAAHLAKLRKEAREVDTSSGFDEPDEPTMSEGDGPPVVLWVSIPGFRGDYLDKSETPFFDSMTSDGGSTTKLRPIFPSLSYPAHATLATGVLPGKHGIVADRMRGADGAVVENPTDTSLLKAEPIWTTVANAGMKTLIHGWPLSGSPADPGSTDEQRLNTVFDQWKASAPAGGGAAAPAAPAEGEEEAGGDAKPANAGGADASAYVRLVMVKLDGILEAGKKGGPRDDSTYDAVSATDKALGDFIDKVKGEWNNLAPANGNLIVMVSTDHGMAERQKNVNIGHLLGDEMMANADIVAHDAVANLYFKGLPESEAEKKVFMEKFDGELSKRIYFRTYKKEELPPEWDYTGDNIGDRVLVLKTGYAFEDFKADEPVYEAADGPGMYGCFGYPVGESIRMSGQAIIWGTPKSPASGDLGEIKQTMFHATVCKILGIEAAAGAVQEALSVY